MIHYLIIFYLSLTALIFCKNFIVPTLFYLILPISDFRSTLFEVTILISGLCAAILFWGIGYFSNRFFTVNRRTMIIFIHLIFLPFFLAKWFSSVEWLNRWSDLTIDLIAEPYRLLTFSYHFGDIVGVWLPILLTCFGLWIRIRKEKGASLIGQIYRLKAQR